MKKIKIFGLAFLTLLASCGNEWREVSGIQALRYKTKLKLQKKTVYTKGDSSFLYSTDEHLLDTMMKDDSFFKSKIKSKKKVEDQVYVITEDHDAYQFVNLNSTSTKENKAYYSYWANAATCSIKDDDVKSIVYFPNYLILTKEDIENKSFDIDSSYKYENVSFAEFYKDLGMEIVDDKIYLDCFLGMISDSQNLLMKKKMILSIKENEFSFHLEE